MTTKICNCCGEVKKAREHFTFTRGYAKHCKDCGVWLRLLREVFGKTRDWDRNREQCRVRDFENSAIQRHRGSTPLATTLQNAWR